ncbi:family 43 glycosylhydrolase [Microbacterium hominis]|uniref:Family 43 glycosylhydrolase n=1 Tax=Microbacterium hominis TaxID=162426 RepID=A0A7D4UIX9_9MICO|nr:family 43 glycosylhydrolase [Microbacterium hominis]QKJ20428.1 family 43 glycosylhydrolase [Microbacterium hominis]
MPPLVVNGVPWFDDRGLPVNAHGGCIVEHEGRWYLFGEYKTDDENTFIGFSCYSSTDLATWTFERIVLPRQQTGLLGPGRIGERVKVMRSPATGQFVMFMHADDLGYTDPHTCIATSDEIAGEYSFEGPLRFDGQPIRRWDIGTFQDDDGEGYLLVHEGDIYRLRGDYRAAVEKVASGIAPGGESPAMFARDGRYHLIFSRKTSWERNDNVVMTADELSGPWVPSGTVAPIGTLTHNSQATFVLRLERDGRIEHLFMGDRWSFPHQASAATYVWQPVARGGDMLLPEYWPAWDSATFTRASVSESADARIDGPLAQGGEAVAAAVSGGRVIVSGRTDRHSGYARVEIMSGGTTHVSQLIDWYSLEPNEGVRFIGPELPPGEYTVRVSATGEWPSWTDKTRTIFGSDGPRVQVTAIGAIDGVF